MKIQDFSQEDENKEKQEKRVEQRFQDKFNSVTEKVKPENQNQEHNIRKEGIAQSNQKR